MSELSVKQLKRRALLEDKCRVARDVGAKASVDFAKALFAIHEEKLYLDHGTWEEYCAKVWGFSRGEGYRQADYGRKVLALSPIGDILPTESQARELEGGPERLRITWELVLTQTETPTAADVKDVAEALAGLTEQQAQEQLEEAQRDARERLARPREEKAPDRKELYAKKLSGALKCLDGDFDFAELHEQTLKRLAAIAQGGILMSESRLKAWQGFLEWPELEERKAA